MGDCNFNFFPLDDDEKPEDNEIKEEAVVESEKPPEEEVPKVEVKEEEPEPNSEPSDTDKPEANSTSDPKDVKSEDGEKSEEDSKPEVKEEVMDTDEAKEKVLKNRIMPEIWDLIPLLFIFEGTCQEGGLRDDASAQDPQVSHPEFELSSERRR